MEKINDLAKTGSFVTIRLPFRPVQIPVDDELKFYPNSTNFLYSALVLQADSKKWSIFEFGEDVMSALNGYALRNNGMQKIEVMVSRFADNSLKLTIGGSGLEEVESIVGAEDFAKKADMADRIIERYLVLSKKGQVQLSK